MGLFGGNSFLCFPKINFFKKIKIKSYLNIPLFSLNDPLVIFLKKKRGHIKQEKTHGNKNYN